MAAGELRRTALCGWQVGQLLQGVSERSPQHRAMLTRMAIRGLQGHTTPAGFRL